MPLLRLRPGLQVGQAAPEFELLDEDGQRHSLASHPGRWLVIFFYPKDDSPGCIREACAFNDDFELFSELGADILGCSGQDAESHRRFRQGCRLRYRLLSDPGRVLRDSWQVPHFLRLIDGRCTFLIDPRGFVRWVHNEAGRPEQHSALALAFLRQAAAPKEQE